MPLYTHAFVHTCLVHTCPVHTCLVHTCLCTHMPLYTHALYTHALCTHALCTHALCTHAFVHTCLVHTCLVHTPAVRRCASGHVQVCMQANTHGTQVCSFSQHAPSSCGPSFGLWKHTQPQHVLEAANSPRACARQKAPCALNATDHVACQSFLSRPGLLCLQNLKSRLVCASNAVRAFDQDGAGEGGFCWRKLGARVEAVGKVCVAGRARMPRPPGVLPLPAPSESRVELNSMVTTRTKPPAPDLGTTHHPHQTTCTRPWHNSPPTPSHQHIWWRLYPHHQPGTGQPHSPRVLSLCNSPSAQAGTDPHTLVNSSISTSTSFSARAAASASSASSAPFSAACARAPSNNRGVPLGAQHTWEGRADGTEPAWRAPVPCRPSPQRCTPSSTRTRQGRTA